VTLAAGKKRREKKNKKGKKAWADWMRTEGNVKRKGIGGQKAAIGEKESSGFLLRKGLWEGEKERGGCYREGEGCGGEKRGDLP